MILTNFLSTMMRFTYKYLTIHLNPFLLLAIRGSILVLLNHSLIIYNGWNAHIANKKSKIFEHLGFNLMIIRSALNLLNAILGMAP